VNRILLPKAAWCTAHNRACCLFRHNPLYPTAPNCAGPSHLHKVIYGRSSHHEAGCRKDEAAGEAAGAASCAGAAAAAAADAADVSKAEAGAGAAKAAAEAEAEAEAGAAAAGAAAAEAAGAAKAKA